MIQNANNLLKCDDSAESPLYLTWSFVKMRWLERVNSQLGKFSNHGFTINSVHSKSTNFAFTHRLSHGPEPKFIPDDYIASRCGGHCPLGLGPDLDLRLKPNDYNIFAILTIISNKHWLRGQKEEGGFGSIKNKQILV